LSGSDRHEAKVVRGRVCPPADPGTQDPCHDDRPQKPNDQAERPEPDRNDRPVAERRF